MDLKDLSIEMEHLVEQKGWNKPGSSRPQTPRNMAISISIEAAELLEHYQWGDHSQHPEELRSEAADVLLYLLQLARLEGIDLEQAVLEKLAINHHRIWEDPSA